MKEGEFSMSREMYQSESAFRSSPGKGHLQVVSGPGDEVLGVDSISEGIIRAGFSFELIELVKSGVFIGTLS
jgi:hypothetical protein